MIPAAQLAGLPAKRWFYLGLLFLLLGAPESSPRAQTPLQSPTKAATKSSPQSRSAQTQGDPLALLLQQAKDAIDKNDFASALEPLQKVLAQRPDDQFTHFQLGFAYAGLKR